MPNGKPRRDAETIASDSEVVAPAGTHVRHTVVAGDRLASFSPESLAGTVGIADAVWAAEQLAAIAGHDRYAPVRELGRGGMGRVDVIFDRALGRPVARKMVFEGRHMALLVAEAQICAQLEHPSIVPVYDVGADTQGNPHYTMRVVRGRTLRDVLDDNDKPEKPRVGLTQLLGILRQVCLAVEYAHSRGVVHRDLKPENIIVGEFGEVYVLDWGVAYVTPDSDIHRATPRGSDLSVAGSPGYMAPEQAMGETIEARTDVFALGVILHEVLTGKRPFDDKDLPSILKRIAKQSFPPPSLMAAPRHIPPAFDDLVRACLRRSPAERPASARFVAEAIDAFLDGERARAEREREAELHAREGESARDAFEMLDAEARKLHAEADALLSETKAWEPPARKQSAWDRIDDARRLSSEAARALARAEAAFARALGRVPDHRASRRGLAALHFRQFEAAESDGDAEKMAQYLDLARAYDDGALALELADEGELVVQASRDARVTAARFEARGLVLSAGPERDLGKTPTEVVGLAAGSYLIRIRTDGCEIRCPVLIDRAKRFRLRARIPADSEVPEGFVLVPGGPFLAMQPRAARMVSTTLPDFAIARFPVTLREYVRFLDALPAEERDRRLPGFGYEGKAVLIRGARGWDITDYCVEGEARKRISTGRALDLPVHLVSWFDAVAYARWLAETTGKAVRLPSDLEWEKAMRGADGRAFPMGDHLDPSFAKLRESRPEATQLEPVGAFPLDESPYGVRDLAGGVGDWTASPVEGDALPSLDDEGTVAGEQQAYWRGGNWGSSATARGMRYPMQVHRRTTGVGFRLALSLDQHGSTELVVEPMKR